SLIIREEFADKFKEIFEPKLAGKIETDYVYQSYDLTSFGIDKEIERAKPWGTAHAVLSARNQINEPFCVINADDFYGYEAFEKMAKFLTEEVSDDKFSLMGYQIDKTLSDYGSVSRGVCKVDDAGNMTEINERLKVYFKEVDGEKRIFFEEEGVETELPRSSRVSMNFWGFTPAIFDVSEELFKAFVPANEDNPKSEFLIPKVADELIKNGKATFKVLPTSQKWVGVTYPEDKPIVQENIAQLVKDGVYPERLF